MFSGSRNSADQTNDSLPLSMSSSFIHAERKLVGIAHANHDNQFAGKGRFQRKPHSSNSSTATSSTASSSAIAAANHANASSSTAMTAGSPTDSGYLSRRQTPRHIAMCSSTKNLATNTSNTVSDMINEAAAESGLDSPVQSPVSQKPFVKSKY